MLAAYAATPVEALIYSTLPSRWEDRMTLAMDGDPKTAFRSRGGMDDGDGFTVFLSRPVSVRSLRVETGEADGKNRLEHATLETTADGTLWTKAAPFAGGLAEARPSAPILGLRIRVDAHGFASRLVVREIAVDSATPVAHVQMGPGRPFTDTTGYEDLAGWARKGDVAMEAFWPDAAALLYSKGFVTPNAVYVRFITGPNLPPAATGGGVMSVDAEYARKHPDDWGLTVHEMAHVVQSGTSPGWLTEAVADYVRWIRYEPQNFTYSIKAGTTDPHQYYRPGGAFLAWCENHYDPALVTKLNDAARFGRYRDALFERYCGKPIGALWAEFMAEYAKDPKGVLVPPVSPAAQPRTLPTVTGPGTPVDLAYDTIVAYPDGATFRANGGFDTGGAAYSATLLGRTVRANGVTFRIGPAGAPDAAVAKGGTVRLSGKHRSLWILAAAFDGAQRDETMTVTYDDGTTARLDQSFSDWADPQEFPGEVRAIRMPYRVLAGGKREEQPFYAYAYGFPLDPTKDLQSVALPDNPNLRVLAVTVAD